ncbi:MAG: type II toxin-antitoxin system RelB/DinJ family antitoxin [Defluviitaleaceae bacterium]|nr:type II toxin-antitoxin system RelB/DinJ family antitoxin [Defluviitaleaceae bacterium]
MATTNLNIRIDENLKRQSEEIFNELGLNMSTALTVFLRQTVRSRGIPFDMRLSMPNDETLDAMREGNEIIKSGKARFDNAEDMFKALKS